MVVLIMLSSTTAVFAQALTWGNVRKSGRSSMYRKIMGFQDNEIFTLCTVHPLFKKTIWRIDVFDADNLNFDRELTLPAPEIPGYKTQFNDVILAGGHLMVLTKAESYSENLLHASQVHPKTGEVIRYQLLNSNLEKDVKWSYQYTLNQDGSNFFLLAQGRVPGVAGVVFHVSEWNDSLNVIWHNQFQLPVETGDRNVMDFISDSQGNIFFLVSNIMPAEKGLVGRNQQLNSRTYSLFMYNRRSNTIKELEINLGAKLVSAVTLKLDNAGKPVVAGFYTDKNGMSILGTFFIRADVHTGLVLNSSMKALTEAQISDLSSAEGKKGKPLESYYFDHMITLQDGGNILLAEKFLSFVSTWFDPSTNMISYSSNLYYNEILVVRTDVDGNILWIKVVPKKQYSSNDFGIYSSYSVWHTKTDDIHLLFNAHNSSDYANRKIRTMSVASKAVIQVVKISPIDGSFTFDIAGDNKSAKINFSPSLFYSSEEHGMVVFAQRSNKVKFGRYR